MKIRLPIKDAIFEKPLFVKNQKIERAAIYLVRNDKT